VGENGKTTLIKLLTRLYTPDEGRILLDGLDLQEWDIKVLHQRIGVIFQNFVRYQFTVVGVGDVEHLGTKLAGRPLLKGHGETLHRSDA